MATAKPNKFTLRGIVEGFVTMSKPDTKYKPEGEYKLGMRVRKDNPRLKPILEEIDRLTDAANEQFVESNAKLPATKRFRGELPYQLPYVDLEDGTLYFKFKSIASGVNQKGERWERVIPHFGADGRIPQNEIPAYGAGTDLAISFTIAGFANKVAGQGCALRLEQVKLYEVKAFGGGNRSDFDDDGEGYSAPSGGGNRSDFDDEDPTDNSQGGNASGDDDVDF